MNSLEKNIKPYSKAMVRLLKAPVERSVSVWQDILHYQQEIQDYISQLGLELVVRKDEGFAFVRQFEDSEGNTLGLVVRRPLGFEVSVILIVLRQLLEEFDSNPTQFQVAERFITNTEIKEEIALFLQEGYNRIRFIKELDHSIARVVELGYLKEISRKDQETTFQIHRIIKEKVSLDVLKDFQEKLQAYVESV
ncbi:MAG: hypothetical protein RL181_1429 [Bacteroidota bacterium]|jgi:hypothetical protein